MHKRLNIIVPQDLYELLRKKAFDEHTTMSKIINDVVRASIENNIPGGKVEGVTMNKPLRDKIKEKVFEKKPTKGDMTFT